MVNDKLMLWPVDIFELGKGIWDILLSSTELQYINKIKMSNGANAYLVSEEFYLKALQNN